METWYVAVLIVASSIKEAPEHTGTTDVQIRLLRATDPDSAFAKAIEYGERENVSYLNEHGQTVVWSFFGLYDLRSLDLNDLDDDTEVYNILTERPPQDLVCAKDELTAFWTEANDSRTAAEILGPS